MKKEEAKAGAQYVYDYIKGIIDKTGPRLPGTEEERQGALLTADIMEGISGKKAVVEEFDLHPNASIGAIPVVGYLGLISFAVYYLSPIATLVLSTLTLLFSIAQIFTYSGWFDFLFPKRKSQNVYTTIEPKNGEEVKYTICFSAHMDSCWCWNHSLRNPKTAIPKIVIGVVGFVLLIVMSAIAVGIGMYSFATMSELAAKGGQFDGMDVFKIVMYVLPVITVPGSYWLADYLTWDKKKASPGAMDNLSGIGIFLAYANYVKEHPEVQPEGCRLMFAAMGAEEASLKGSFAFCKKHKDDGMLENMYNINLDSFRDDKYFSAVIGDLWLGSRFDRDLIDLSKEAMAEALGEDVTPKCPGEMFNPVGGCDSTPFCRAGVKTVTLVAQNPTLTDYYHTCNDTVEGLSMYSLEKGFETVVNLVPKIDELAKKQGLK